MRHQGCWRGNEGAPVARETGEGVCAGLSANTVCAGVRASSVKLQLLCSQVLKSCWDRGLMGPSESGDIKATVAVLSFILPSVAKHSVDGGSLSSELQQLGLPKAPTCYLQSYSILPPEHAASLCHCYEEKQSPLQKHMRVCSLRSKYEASQGPGSF
uniref:Uncharacterized protein n=1 Tax=Theropithecus gelada TaxID=9565 RepID=A0A8D2E6Q3_THEGE